MNITAMNTTSQLNQTKAGMASQIKTVAPEISLADINPDFVLKVVYETDKATRVPSSAAQMDLARLVKTLDVNSFSVTIRPDSFNSLLVFVKLTDDIVSQLIRAGKAKDFIYGVTSSDDDESTVSIAHRLRLIYDKITGPKSEGGCGITVGEGDWNFVRAVLPLGNYSQIKAEYSKAKSGIYKVGKLDDSQVAFLLDNFGSKYAFYFAFLSQYLYWLMGFSIVGVASNIVYGRFSFIYAVLNILFTTGFYMFWKVKQASYARKWGVENVGIVETSRVTAISPDPEYKSLAKSFMFIPAMVTFGCTLFAYQMGCFFIEIFLTELYDGPGKSLLALVPTVLLSVIVPIVTIIYKKLIDTQMKFESHKKQSTYQYSYVIKMFLFNFLTSYMALIITSFIYLPFGYTINPYLGQLTNHVHTYVSPKISIRQENYEVNKLRLNTQYQFFIVTNQIVGVVLEFILPVVLAKVFAIPFVKKLLGTKPEDEPVIKDDESEAELLSHARETLSKPPFDIDDEYRQLILQFGYLALFGPIWSIGPMVSTVINLIQYKFDYIKMLGSVRTPVPDRADSIFPWDHIMKFLVSVGSVISISITLMYNQEIVSSPSLPGTHTKWWFVIGSALITEHAVSLCISAGEKIISKYLDTDSPTFEFKKDYARKLHGEYNAKSVIPRKESNDVDDLLKSATLLPQSIVPPTSTSSPTAPATLSEKLATQNVRDRTDDNDQKESSPGNFDSATTSRSHSYAALAQSPATSVPPKSNIPDIPAMSTPTKTLKPSGSSTPLDPKKSLSGFGSTVASDAAAPVAVPTTVPQTTHDVQVSDEIVTSGFDFQKGDHVITVPSPNGGTVEAVIDDNTHFNPQDEPSFATTVDESDASFANTTAESAEGAKLKKKKSKMALKSIFKKKD